jgi:fructosamine-3-kinase
MFEAERDGLLELAAAGEICVPQPLLAGIADGQAYIVMEGLALGGQGSPSQLGQELAALHRHTHERFGWYRDNTIGATHQDNTPHYDWLQFWRERRLGAQLEMAKRNGAPRGLLQQGERLLDSFPRLFDGYTPVPSLLHGDLWSGNHAFVSSGEPVIFDPAVYYGDREAELAMTELFGGFGSEFYAAYNEAWPLDPGYRVRKSLYNLYHVLNHFNMFGGGYGRQADAMVGRLLAQLG